MIDAAEVIVRLRDSSDGVYAPREDRSGSSLRAAARLHFGSWRQACEKAGLQMRKASPRPRAACSVDGCDKPHQSRGYCGMHYMRIVKGCRPRDGVYISDPVERLWAHVEKTESCWLWTGHTANGYGVLWLTRDGRNTTVRAHRFAYELLVGPITEGLTLDHICHGADCSGGITCPHRRCVNPAHLKPATIAENVRRSRAGRRQGICKRGHEIDYSSGRGYCPVCRNEAQRRRIASKRSAGPGAVTPAKPQTGDALCAAS